MNTDPTSKKKTFADCVEKGLNPNPNPPGELKSLGCLADIRSAAKKGFERMKRAFAMNSHAAAVSQGFLGADVPLSDSGIEKAMEMAEKEYNTAIKNKLI